MVDEARQPAGDDLISEIEIFRAVEELPAVAQVAL